MVSFDHERKWSTAFPSTMSFAISARSHSVRALRCNLRTNWHCFEIPERHCRMVRLAMINFQLKLDIKYCVCESHSISSWQFAAMNLFHKHAVQMETKPIRCDWMNANISTLTHPPTVKRSHKIEAEINYNCHLRTNKQSNKKKTINILCGMLCCMTALTKLNRNTNMCNRRWLFYALSSFTRSMNKQMNKLFLSVFLSFKVFEKTDRRVNDEGTAAETCDESIHTFSFVGLLASTVMPLSRCKCNAKLLKKMSLLLYISVSVFPSFSAVCSLHSNRLSYVCRGSSHMRAISQYIVLVLPVFPLPFFSLAHFV